MSLSKTQEYQNMLFDLLTGNITPRSVVGTGYKYPRQVASAWIRLQLHNLTNTSERSRINGVHVKTDGKAFDSEAKAMASSTYKMLVAGNYKTIDDSIVSDYGVMPATGSDGYMIFVATKHVK